METSPDTLLADKLNKAIALHQAGNLGEAAALYRDILTADPNNVMAIHLLCAVAMQFDNAQMVLNLAEQGIRIEPNFAVLHQDKATAQRRLGFKEDALATINTAIRLQKSADFYETRASILRDMRRYPEAVASLEMAIKLQADNPKFYNNLGIILGRMGSNEEAVCYFDAFIKMRPHAAEGYNNKANVLKAMGRYKEAIVHYGKALDLDPNILMGKANKGISHLVLGEWEEGWTLFEDRKPGNKAPEGHRFDPAKRWHGGAFKNATLLAYNEQGLGDTIQFARYIPMLLENFGRVIVQIQPALNELFRYNWPQLEFITPEMELPAHDWQCPLMSLPYVFKTRVDNVPSAKTYLSVPPEKIVNFKNKIPQDGRKKIGLVWAGNPDHLNDHIRSVTLQQLLPILALKQFDFFAIQKGEAPLTQITALTENITIHAMGDVLHDFTDTAGLLKNLDLLISVDTSVLHLAGALGVPTWGLIQFDPDWRWLLERSDTPWYESVRLFRQKSYGHWPGAINELKSALKLLN